MRNHPKIAELSELVNKKARELQDVQEEVDRCKEDVRQLGERKGRLKKEIDSYENEIKEKQSHLEQVIGKESIFLSNIKKEVSQETEKLLQIRLSTREDGDKLVEVQSRLKEYENYAQKIDEVRKIYLENKDVLGKLEADIKDFLQKNELTKEEIAREKTELGQYKNYLTEFYGKVATYTVTAKEILEYVNEALRENIPLRFEPPKEPITMDNFNK